MPSRPPPRKSGDAPPARRSIDSGPGSSGEGSRTALARLIEQEKSRRSTREALQEPGPGPTPAPEEPSESA